MTTLTTVGYGDITAKSHAQMFYAAFTQLVGVGVFGFILSNVASLLSRLDAPRESYMDNLDQIESFMSSYRIHAHLRSKVRSYYHYVWKEHRGRLDRSILSTLPLKLQSELNFSINHSIISHVSFLKTATKEMLYDMMLALDHRVFVPGERIFKAGEEATCLYLIHSGTVEILTADGKNIATLHQGAVFGEMALIAEGARSASARANSYCDLYLLPKTDFKRIINSYPEFHAHLQDIIKSRKQASSEAAKS